MVDVKQDIRKTLLVLRNEWENCTRCELGARRKTVGGKFVFGEGVSNGIMFIGEGPGTDEETEGRPFVGMSGRILRGAIEKIGIRHYYITNAVSCRACGESRDKQGNVRYKKVRGVLTPVITDQPPTPFQLQACLPRLYEEIYQVDPVLIVSLGGQAAEVLTGKAIGILAERGQVRSIGIPGAGNSPSLTDKKKAWVRKVHGELSIPTHRNIVEYLLLPLLHPAYVARKRKDQRQGNPVEMFANDMEKAARLYERYRLEVYGDSTTIGHFGTDDILAEFAGEEDADEDP